MKGEGGSRSLANRGNARQAGGFAASSLEPRSGEEAEDGTSGTDGTNGTVARRAGGFAAAGGGALPRMMERCPYRAAVARRMVGAQDEGPYTRGPKVGRLRRNRGVIGSQVACARVVRSEKKETAPTAAVTRDA